MPISAEKADAPKSSEKQNSFNDIAIRINKAQRIPAEIAELFIAAKGKLAFSGFKERFDGWQRQKQNS